MKGMVSMAEQGEKRRVKRVFIDADTGKQISEQTVVTDAKDVATEVKIKNVEATGEVGNKRIIAVVLWIVAIILEALAICSVMQSSPLYGKLPFFEPLVWMIIFLALDLVCVIIAGQLWKKANHIDPPSEKNAFEFFVKSQLGAILSVARTLIRGRRPSPPLLLVSPLPLVWEHPQTSTLFRPRTCRPCSRTPSSLVTARCTGPSTARSIT